MTQQRRRQCAIASAEEKLHFNLNLILLQELFFLTAL